MQQVSWRDLIPGKSYRIHHIDGLLQSRLATFINNVNLGREFLGVSLFNNIILSDGNVYEPGAISGYRNDEWIFFENERNTMLRKKNTLERPRTVNGLSIKEELLQRGPWSPNRINRARTMGYRNNNDPEGNWEPAVVGYGRGPRARSRKTRKSRR